MGTATPFLRRRFRRRPSTAVLLGLFLLILMAGRLALDSLWQPRGSQNALLHEGTGRAVDVIDGQTLLVQQDAQAERRVRLLGIEMEAEWSARGAEFLSHRTADTPIELKFDKRRVDRQHHQLAYVYIAGTLLNEQLVREGFARAAHYPGDSSAIAKRLVAAENEARRARRGRWSTE